MTNITYVFNDTYLNGIDLLSTALGTFWITLGLKADSFLKTGSHLAHPGLKLMLQLKLYLGACCFHIPNTGIAGQAPLVYMMLGTEPGLWEC